MRIKPLTTILAAAFVATSVFAADDVKRLSEPVNATETYEEFGSTLPEGQSAQSLSEVISEIDGKAARTVLIETEIEKVCQKKGCFFIARDGSATARVRFKDYGFFIPTDSAGKTVKLAGTLERVELSPEQAEHFAEDLGEDPAAVPMAEFEYQVMATAVRIPKV